MYVIVFWYLLVYFRALPVPDFPGRPWDTEDRCDMGSFVTQKLFDACALCDPSGSCWTFWTEIRLNCHILSNGYNVKNLTTR